MRTTPNIHHAVSVVLNAAPPHPSPHHWSSFDHRFAERIVQIRNEGQFVSKYPPSWEVVGHLCKACSVYAHLCYKSSLAADSLLPWGFRNVYQPSIDNSLLSQRKTVRFRFHIRPTMEPADATALDRTLRLLTCLATAICVPLDIAATVLSMKFQSYRWARRGVTAYCFIFIPLAITVVSAILSLRYMKKHGKTPRGLDITVLDLAAICGYIGTMITCWVLEISEYNDGGFGLLTGYLTAAMMVSM
jgi:hypothetical protein